MREMLMDAGYSRTMSGLNGETLRGLGRKVFLGGCPLVLVSGWLGNGDDWFWFRLWYASPLLHVILAGLFAWCGFKGLELDRRGPGLKFRLPFFMLTAGLALATMRAWPTELLNMTGGARITLPPAAELAATVFFNGQLYWILLPLLVWLIYLSQRPLARDLCALGGAGLLLLVTLNNGFPNFLQFAGFMVEDMFRLSVEHILR